MKQLSNKELSVLVLSAIAISIIAIITSSTNMEPTLTGFSIKTLIAGINIQTIVLISALILAAAYLIGITLKE